MKSSTERNDWGIWIVVLPCILIVMCIIGVLAWQMYPRVTGRLNADTSGLSTWTFTPNTCRIALENGAIGITLTSSHTSGRIRIHDGTFDTSSSSHAIVFQKESSRSSTLNPKNCETFELKTEWRAGSLYSDSINAVTGRLRLNCTDTELGHLAGTINFVSCPLEEGTTIM